MLLRIDPSSPEALFAQIAASVRADVARGSLKPGDRLPPARAVAAELDVNLHTVLRAYQELRDEGIVDMRPGRGAVVTGSAGDIGSLHVKVASLVDEARSRGIADEVLVSLVKVAQREAG
jgi:GntR family transcriptional regulator